MKKILLMSMIAGTISVGLSACSSKNEEQKTESVPTEQPATDTYACPMKCGEQTFDKPGQCPECNMDLEKVNPS